MSLSSEHRLRREHQHVQLSTENLSLRAQLRSAQHNGQAWKFATLSARHALQHVWHENERLKQLLCINRIDFRYILAPYSPLSFGQVGQETHVGDAPLGDQRCAEDGIFLRGDVDACSPLDTTEAKEHHP